VDRPADDTFDTKTDAEKWLTLKEAEILEGDWIDPDAGNAKAYRLLRAVFNTRSR
jgi:hypothetical protein